MFRFVFVLAAAGLSVLAPVARAAPPPIEAYGALPSMEQITLSPSGTRYAFIARVGETRRLYVATTDNKPLSITELGDSKVTRVAWAGDDYVLVTSVVTKNLGLDFAVSKHELTGVAVLDLTKNSLWGVFIAHHAEVAGAVFGDFGTAQIDGRWYGFFAGVTYEKDKGGGYLGHAYPDLYRVDLATGGIHLVARGSENIRQWLVDQSGQPMARVLYDQQSGAWKAQSLGPGGRQLAAGVSPLGAAILEPGRKPGTLLIRKPADNAAYDYQEVALADGAATDAEGVDNIDYVLFDRVTRAWVGQVDRGDDQPTTFYDPALETRWKATAKAFPGYRTVIEAWSADFNRLIVFTDGKDDSGTYWLVDIAKHNAAPLGGAYPAVKPSQVGQVRMVDYKAADGLALRGVLTLPPGREAKNLPLIVMPHGGPVDRDGPGFDWWAQAFAGRGYAVFQPNFRGSSGYGAAFEAAGYGQWGRKMQTDISDGLQELVRQGVADPRRACIVGGSYGGYAALAGVTLQQGLYRCAVAVAGVADLSQMLNYQRDLAGGPSARERQWKTFLGVTTMWETELKPLSPARLAARADAPILLIHGKEDTTVPVDQSQTMERALRSAGKPVEALYLPGGDHQLSQAQTRIDMLKAAVAFVEKYDPPDAPAAAGAP